MESVFSKIIAGSIPCFKISENALFLAFLDIQPLRKGHVLVVPKVEVDKFYELDTAYLAEWLVFAQPIAKAIEKAIPCKRVGMSIVGLEVAHAHMHLVPISSANDLNFTQHPFDFSQEQLAEVQQLILQHLV